MAISSVISRRPECARSSCRSSSPTGSSCRPRISSRIAAYDWGSPVSDLSIIIMLVFLAASFAIYGFYWVFIFNRREQRVINRRLELGRQLRNPTAVLATLRDERGIRNVGNPRLRQLSDWLTQTGTDMSGKTFVAAFAAVCVVLAFAMSPVVGFLGAICLAVVA